MPGVVSVGARAFLDKEQTDAEFLAICVGLFAELDDGRRVDVDPSYVRTRRPRRGLGAVWVQFDGDVAELPGFDAELAARDPYQAEVQALESSYRLQRKDIEDSVRRQLLHGGAPVRWGAHASERDVEQDRLARERGAGHIWSNLVRALATEGIDATPEVFRSVPFRMEFDAELVAELER
jgi:hypothetical protein